MQAVITNQHVAVNLRVRTGPGPFTVFLSLHSQYCEYGSKYHTVFGRVNGKLPPSGLGNFPIRSHGSPPGWVIRLVVFQTFVSTYNQIPYQPGSMDQRARFGAWANRQA